MGMALAVPRYTVDDLDRFPDDGNRYELLDGMLLVTPAPSQVHQVVATRIALTLGASLVPNGLAQVVAPGALRRPPANQLQPDVLVYPAHQPLGVGWEKISSHWLAVEVLSRSSRVYDRDFKRDAYLALGVHEVWLVDPFDHSVEVSRPGARERVTDTLRWRVPATGATVALRLEEIFAGVP